MQGKERNTDKLYTLIPLEEFKAVLGVDDREDKIARFCLVTSTFTIEQYCKRRLLKKKHFETIEFTGELVLPLREYPVSKMLAAFLMSNEQLASPLRGAVRLTPPLTRRRERLGMSNGEVLEPEFYRVIPDLSMDMDLPFSIELSPAVKRLRNLKAIKIVYIAGYAPDKVPADLSAACMELAMWNMNRYRGRRIGMTGNVRGGGKDGEHFEMSMPANVRFLLETYRRKTI